MTSQNCYWNMVPRETRVAEMMLVIRSIFIVSLSSGHNSIIDIIMYPIRTLSKLFYNRLIPGLRLGHRKRQPPSRQTRPILTASPRVLSLP